MISVITDHKTKKISVKRVIVILLIILLTVVIIGHMFFGKTIEEYIYNGLIEAVIWSMGFIGSEKFMDAIPQVMANRRSNKPLNNTPIPEDSAGDLI